MSRSAAATAARAPAGRRAAGFTLLELMVTAGVIAVLFGIAVGYLGRSSGVAEARSAIAGQLRLAASDARSRGLPTRVVLTPAPPGGVATVEARGLVPLACFGFEPGQAPADAALRPRLGGTEVPDGRFGRARAPDPAHGPAVLEVPLGPAVAFLGAGFALRMDLRLDRRDGGRLVRLGRGLEVTLDPDARPRVRAEAERPATGAATTTAGGGAVNLLPETALPVGRWCTLEVGADGSTIWCSLDGRVLAREDFSRRLLQERDDVLQILPVAEPVPGAVDEVQLFAYASSEPVQLAQSIVLEQPVHVLFDELGEPFATGDIRLVVTAEERTEVLRVGRGGVLQ